MTRHVLTDPTYTIDAAFGWDGALQQFFLDITRKCTECDGDGEIELNYESVEDCSKCHGEGTVYLFTSNLPRPIEPQAIVEKLLEHGLFWPEQIITSGGVLELLEREQAADRRSPPEQRMPWLDGLVQLIRDKE